jgi:galactose-1-phosphate uridylyltransferase
VKSLKKSTAKKLSELKENSNKDFATASSVCLTATVRCVGEKTRATTLCHSFFIRETFSW